LIFDPPAKAEGNSNNGNPAKTEGNSLLYLNSPISFLANFVARPKPPGKIP
jgi:hypothetical protein